MRTGQESAGVRGREPLAPIHADHGQGDLFRANLRSRTAFWALFLGAAGTFLFGAWKRDPLIMAVGPAAVVLGVTGIAWFLADRAAARRFYSGFARSVGLGYASRFELLPLTPLLAAGQRRRAEHWMYGRLPGDLQGGLGHFVWERIERDRDGDPQVRERNRFTLCVADLEPSMALFKGVFLRPRRGLIASHSDWLKDRPASPVEVESTAFTERYELLVADDQDQLVLRRLLSPTLVAWLANHPLTPGFEVKAGALVVYVPYAIEDAGNLTYLVDAARHLAARVLGEVEEDRLRAA
ncbi:MAG TPA: hypothetical protein VG126_08940 [Thermoleophilaceae bacterium]|nr:hypothetical protein [Thermoleophilaceae bacterium]